MKHNRWRSHWAVFIKIFAFVFLTWLLRLSWSPNDYIMSYDGFAMLAWMQHYLHQMESTLTYIPYLLGGAKGTQTFGTLGAEHVLGYLGLSAQATLNLAVMLTQSFIAYMSWLVIENNFVPKSAEERKKKNSTAPLDSLEYHLKLLGLTWLTAFAPYVVWRLSHGHLNILQSVQFFVSCLALVSFVFNKQREKWPFIFIALSFIFCIPSSGHQVKLYALSFGLPILIAGLLEFKEKTTWNHKITLRACVLFTFGLGCFLLVFPIFWEMFSSARSGETARALGKSNIIYSYSTGVLRDWLTSIPWMHNLLPYNRHPGLIHEINFPFGPLIVALAFLIHQKRYPWALGMIVSLILSVGFSNNIFPVAEFMTAFTPMIENFRVPSRSILPFVATLPVVFVFAIKLKERESFDLIPQLVSLAVLLILSIFVEGFFLEASAWAIIVYHLFAGNSKKSLSQGALLFAIGAVSLTGFSQRLADFSPSEKNAIRSAKYGDIVRKQEPSVSNPLVRVKIEKPFRNYSLNTGFAADLSGIDGYYIPTKRFFDFYQGLSKDKVDHTKLNFYVRPNTAEFNVLSNLLNVAYYVEGDFPNQRVKKLPPKVGSAWFSSGMRIKSDLDDLLLEFKNAQNNLPSLLRQSNIVLKNDVGQIPRLHSGCRSGKIKSIEFQKKYNQFKLSVSSPGVCPLSIATNYTKDFYVTNSKGKSFETFPAYGLVLGVLLPSGDHELIIRAKVETPGMIYVLMALGLVIIAFSLTSLTRQRREKAR